MCHLQRFRRYYQNCRKATELIEAHYEGGWYRVDWVESSGEPDPCLAPKSSLGFCKENLKLTYRPCIEEDHPDAMTCPVCSFL